MACNIPYIRQTKLPETEKSRLEDLHISIFEQARDSKIFRKVNDRFQTIKAKYAQATEFVGKINSQEGKPISSIKSIGNGNSVLSVNVLPLTEERIFLQKPNVEYQLKSVNILQSPKADEVFRKGDKNNWTIDKILQELQVPKEQQELIKSFNTRNREEILTSLLANYSYTVEINTAKEEHDGDRTNYWFENKDFFYSLDQDSGKYYKWSKKTNKTYTPLEPEFEISKEQYLKELKETQSKATQYYSNLTVPGGTNYTENEIATPAISPAIKGHAQFSTDNGIGWFRSDDAQTKDDLQRELYTQDFTFEELLQRGEIKQVPCG